ncbi:fatty acid hydroxylase family protein [Pseudonocardiaceae bacterium YIM PH 21723]|nr:fatty acid hydroxylase family protein [Pseudonocardiaceae bacterium YIM PH 21723]
MSTAEQRLAEDEARITGARKAKLTLGQAARGFWRHPSPIVIAVAFVIALTSRLLVGDWQLWDALTPLIMIVAFPFFEWVVHVYVLHAKPVKIFGRTLDTEYAREHRKHHVLPRDIPLSFIPFKSLLVTVAVLAAIGLLAFPRTALGLTFLVTITVFGLLYEWTHYLVHTDYKPKSRVYKAIWRDHRLHHYKDEHYWFTVTSSGTADRVLGTYPDPQSIPSSPTAKRLHGLA